MEQHSPTDGYPNQYFIGGDNNEKKCLEEMERDSDIFERKYLC